MKYIKYIFIIFTILFYMTSCVDNKNYCPPEYINKFIVDYKYNVDSKTLNNYIVFKNKYGNFNIKVNNYIYNKYNVGDTVYFDYLQAKTIYAQAMDDSTKDNINKFKDFNYNQIVIIISILSVVIIFFIEFIIPKLF